MRYGGYRFVWFDVPGARYAGKPRRKRQLSSQTVDSAPVRLLPALAMDSFPVWLL